MPSILPDYDYDIFISYRQKDNKTGWVTEFVENLRNEIEASFKEDISIYFDANRHDGITETDDVDDSLAKKLKCLIFIPIISKTYCDTNSFAWSNEFLAFIETARLDKYSLKVNLRNGNVASRVLPVKIHEISEEDNRLIENETGSVLRAVDFVFQSTGVNRPLVESDDRNLNFNKLYYRDQVNKVANAIEAIISGIKDTEKSDSIAKQSSDTQVSDVRVNQLKNPKVLIGGLVMVMVLLAVYLFLPGIHKKPVNEEMEKSIAVLPFKNLSDDKEQQYFADGVMEDILTQLQEMGELTVTSRTSVEQYRGTLKSATEIGSELGVAYLLEGSIRKAGSQLMITAQLIRTHNDAHVWGKNFTAEYTLEGLFEIQREIARNIVAELQIRLSPEEIQNMDKALTNNKDAYEYYLKGKDYVTRFLKEWDGNLLMEATERFNSAIQLDTNFTMAYLGRAESIRLFYFLASERIPSIEEYQPVIEAVQKAKSLDPDNPFVIRELAWEEYNIYRNYDKALSLLEPVEKSHPNIWQIHHVKGWVLLRMGRWLESIDSFRKGCELDPFNMELVRSCVTALIMCRRFAQADSLLRNALEFDPDNQSLKDEAYTIDIRWKGLFQDDTNLRSIEHAREAFRPTVANPLPLEIARINFINNKKKQAFIYADSAISILKENLNSNGRDYRIAKSIAFAYAIKNETENSMTWFDTAVAWTPRDAPVQAGDRYRLTKIYTFLHQFDLANQIIEEILENPQGIYTVESFKFSPDFDPIRENPRFQEIINRPDLQVRQDLVKKNH